MDDELELENTEITTEPISSSGTLPRAPKNPNIAAYNQRAAESQAQQAESMASVLGRFDRETAQKAMADEASDITTFESMRRNFDSAPRQADDGALTLPDVPDIESMLAENTPTGRDIYYRTNAQNKAKLSLITDKYKNSLKPITAKDIGKGTLYYGGEGIAGITDVLAGAIAGVGLGSGRVMQAVGTLGSQENSAIIENSVLMQDAVVQAYNDYSNYVDEKLSGLSPTGERTWAGRNIVANVAPVIATIATAGGAGMAAAGGVVARGATKGASEAAVKTVAKRAANIAAKRVGKTTAALYGADAADEYWMREAEGKTSQEYRDYLRTKTGGEALSDAAWGVGVGIANYWLEKAFGADAAVQNFFGNATKGLFKTAIRRAGEEGATEVLQNETLDFADLVRGRITKEEFTNNLFSTDTLETFVIAGAIGGFAGGVEYATARANLGKEYKANIKKVFPDITEQQAETVTQAFLNNVEDNVIGKIQKSLIADDQLRNRYGTYNSIVQNRINELIDQSIAQGKELDFKEKTPEYQAQFVGSTAQRFVDELYAQSVLRGAPIDEVFDTTKMQVEDGILYMYGTEYGRRPISQFTRDMTPQQWEQAQREKAASEALQRKAKEQAAAVRAAEREARQKEREQARQEREQAKQEAREAKEQAATEASMPYRDYLSERGVSDTDTLDNRTALRDARIMARAEIRDLTENKARGVLAELRDDLPVETMKASEIKQILRGEIDRFIELRDLSKIREIATAPSILARQKRITTRVRKPKSFSQSVKSAGISSATVEKLGLKGELQQILDRNYRYYVRKNGKITNFEEFAAEYQRDNDSYQGTVNGFLDLLARDIQNGDVYTAEEQNKLEQWRETTKAGQAQVAREEQEQAEVALAQARNMLESTGENLEGMTDEAILDRAQEVYAQMDNIDADIEIDETQIPDDLYFQTLRDEKTESAAMENLTPDEQARKESNESWGWFKAFVQNKFDEFIPANNGDVMYARFNAVDPDTKYKDLRVIVVNSSKIKMGDGLIEGFYHAGTNAIYLPVDNTIYSDKPKLQEYLSSDYVKAIFRHEFTHNQDVARGVPEAQPSATDAEYYNNTAEYNAYSQQAIQHIADDLNKMSPFLRSAALENWTQFLRYSMQVLTDARDGTAKALQNFNQRNKRRFLNRLYKTFESYRQPGHEVFYQKNIGAWNPIRRTIELGEGANETTIAHELSHFWLDNMMLYSRMNAAAQNEGFQAVWKNIKRYLNIDDRQDRVNAAQAEKYTSAYMQYIRNNKIAPAMDLGFKGLDEYIGDISLDYFENALHREDDGTISPELETLTPEIVDALQKLTSVDLSNYRDRIIDLQMSEPGEIDTTDAKLGEFATPDQMRNSGAKETRAQQEKIVDSGIRAAEADAQTTEPTPQTPEMQTAQENLAKQKPTSSRYEIGTTDAEAVAKAREIIARDRQMAESAVTEDPSGITDGIPNAFIALELGRDAIQRGENVAPFVEDFVRGASAAGASLRVASLLNQPEYAWAKDLYEATKAKEYALALRMRPQITNAVMRKSSLLQAMNNRLDEYVEKLYPQLLTAESYEAQVKLINDWGNNTAKELGIIPGTEVWNQAISGGLSKKKTDFGKAVVYQKRKLKEFLKSKLGAALSDAEQLKVRELHRNAIDAMRELRANPTDRDTKINFIKQTRAYQDYLNALQPSNWATALFASVPRASMLFRVSTQVKNTIGTRVEILLSDLNRQLRYGSDNLISKKDMDAQHKESMDMYSIGGFSPDVQESFFEAPTLAWGEKQFSMIQRKGEHRGAVFTKEQLAQDAKEIAQYARDTWQSADGAGQKAWAATRTAIATVERTTGKAFDVLAYSDAYMKATIAIHETAKAATFYAKAEGKAKGWSDAEIKARANELFADARSYIPKTKLGEAIRKQAVEQAKIETFIKSGTLAQMANNVRNALNLGKESGLGTFISPFVSTPANVMQMGVDYATGWWRRFDGWKDVKARVEENAKAGKQIDPKDMAFLEKGYRGTYGALFLLTLFALFKGINELTGDDDTLDYVPPYDQLTQRERQYYRAVNGGKYNAVKVGNTWINVEYFGGLSEAITGLGTWYHNNSVISAGAAEIMRTPVIGDLVQQKDDLQRDIQYNKTVLDAAFDGVESQGKKYIPGIIQDLGKAREKGALYPIFGSSFGLTTDPIAKEVKDVQSAVGATYMPITRGKGFSDFDYDTKRQINQEFDEYYNAEAIKWIRANKDAEPETTKKALNNIRKQGVKIIKQKYKIK